MDTRKKVGSKAYQEAAKANPRDFTRKRKMPFVMLMYFMLARRKSSTQNELERFFNITTKDQVYMTQQAYSEARLKIKVEAFSELFYMTAGLAYEGYYDTWQGYRLLAIDGSKIALPDNELLGQLYGCMGADASSPTAQGSICYDVLNRVIVDAQIEPLAVNERELAMRHIKNLSCSKRLAKELVIMDRGYPSYELCKALSEDGIKFLMRVKRGFNKEIDAQTSADDYVTLHKAGLPDLDVRVIKFMLPSGEMEMLITNLYKRHLSVEDFQQLYFLRWPVEVKFDEVKNKLEIENFTGLSERAIRQDFYATMYLANVAAAAWWEAQERVEEERVDKDNKYGYRVNVNHEIGVLKDRLIMAFTHDDPNVVSAEVERILFLLYKRVCPVKPDRSPARNKSPRKAKFHFNARSNA